MKKVICVILLAVLVISAMAQMNGTKAIVNADTAPVIGKETPLTNAQITAEWPNLPTAKQLYANDVCACIDLQYCGKQVSSMNDSMPNPNSPTVVNMSAIIVNCTTTEVNYLSGAVTVEPQIWLQYNSSIWVQIPSQYLTSTTTDVNPDEGSTTWALGMYANPQQITGSYAVSGVATFGEFSQSTFGSSSSDYLGTNVLTVCSGDYVYQEIMQLTPSGQSIYYNMFNLITGAKTGGPVDLTPGATLGQQYDMYIKYNQGEWQLWWNLILMAVFPNDPDTTVITGNQANTVVETNDFTPGDFSGFSTAIGGTEDGYPLCAAVYLYNGAWKPSNPGDYAPAGYVYLGGTSLNGLTIGNQAPPSSWGSSNIGIYATPVREVFTVGATQPQRSEGYTLWTYGTV